MLRYVTSYHELTSLTSKMLLPGSSLPVRSHRSQTAKKRMQVKENTIPRNHVAARPPASNTNRADQPTSRRRRRILVIGAVIGVLSLFLPLPESFGIARKLTDEFPFSFMKCIKAEFEKVAISDAVGGS